MKTLAMVGGGSLGHVIKHIAVYPYLEDKFDRFIYIGGKRGPEKEYLNGKFPFYSLTDAKLDRSDFKKNLALLKNFLSALSESRKILKEEKPCAVFCGGGYVCLPVAIQAHAMGIPVIIHESDKTLGLANKLCLTFCSKLLTTFKETAKNSKKTVYVGAPVREELLSGDRSLAQKKFGLDKKKKTLLIIGGSLGSKSINDCAACAYEELTKSYNVIHISGKTGDQKPVKNVVKLPFARDMASVYAATDIAVSRCGSNTAFELFACRIPTLFIPLPARSSRGDQIENAEYFEKKGLSKTLSENDLSPEVLVRSVKRLEREQVRICAELEKSFSVGANEKIAKEILSLV